MEGTETLHCHGNSPPSRSISLSSSRSLAETRATLEGEKCGHSREIVFVSFDIHGTTNISPYTADVVSNSNKTLFLQNLYRALKHGGHAEMHFIMNTRRATLRPQFTEKTFLTVRYCFYSHYHCCCYY